MKQFSTLFFCISFLVLIPMLGSAQKVEKKFMKALCDCSETMDVGEDYAELKEKLAACFGEASEPYAAELAAQFEEDRAFKTVDEYVHYLIIEATKECPKLLDYMLQLESEQFKDEEHSEIAHDDPEECRSIHEGTYAYYVNGSRTEAYVSRKGNIQIEGVFDEDTYSVSEIEWLDACTFKSTYKEMHNIGLGTNVNVGDVLTVTVTEIDGEFYSYIVVFGDLEIGGEMKKVSDEFIDPREW